MATRRAGLKSGRQSPARRPRKRRYLVVTNGEVTETQYFSCLTKELGDVVIEVRSFRRDPSGLAKLASDLKASEERSGSGSAWNSVDGFQRVYVVTDVDNYTPEQFREARRICKRAGLELVISNPCFEVWLIDHFVCCPVSCSDAKSAQDKAADLGIVYGSRNKHVKYDAIAGRLDIACENAARHNTEERRWKRVELDTTDYSPWTDMPGLLGWMRSGSNDL